MWSMKRLGIQAAAAFTIAAMAIGVNLGSAHAASKQDGDTHVAVAITAEPSGQGTVSYDIQANNTGKGVAYYTNVVIPINQAELKVSAATLSGKAAWLPTNTPSEIEFRIERLNPGEQSILRLNLTQLVPGAALDQALSFQWSDASGVHSGESNTPQGYQATYSLSVASNGASQIFSANLFAPDEPVTFWYNTPGGSVVPVQVIRNGTAVSGDYNNDKDKDDSEYAQAYVVAAGGAAQLNFSTAGLAAGTYSMVARGNWSGITAVGVFQVP